MAKYQRKKVFVDKQVQGALVVRLLFYWFCTLVTIFFFSLAFSMISLSLGTSAFPTASDAIAQFWSQFKVALLGFVFIVPIVIRDLVKLSHRFAGPMLRMRRVMKQAAAGEKVEPVRFRKNDYWQDFAEDFNRVLERLPQGTAADELHTMAPVDTETTAESATAPTPV